MNNYSPDGSGDNVEITDFELLGTIGQGGYGTILLAEDEDKNQFAIKAIRKALVLSTPDGIVDIFKERGVMSMDNKFKCSLYFAFQDQGYLYLGECGIDYGLYRCCLGHKYL